MNQPSSWAMFWLRKLSLLLVFLFALQWCGSGAEGHYRPDWPSLDSRPLPAWYDQAKVGIFIHWGVFSVPSFHSEWFWWNWRGQANDDCVEFMKKNYRPDFTYADFAKDFRAELFDPIEWADIFNRSGARYMVLTSKHHEGFTLWPSNYSFNWNAKDVGPGRDLVGDLAAAVRRTDLHFGLYHSLYEWFHPLYLRDKQNKFHSRDFVTTKIWPEMKELILKYRPDVLWSDGDWESDYTYWNSTGFLAWLYNDSPVRDTIVTNDRWGIGTLGKHGDFFTNADRYNPKVVQSHKWENAMTLDRKSWGFRRNAELSDYLTIEQLVTELVQTVSCGGNILINVGPTKYGKLAPIFEERLLQLGQWLAINGEAIYETKPWHGNDTVTGSTWYTRKGNQTVYAIALEYPHDDNLILGDVSLPAIQSIQLLGCSKTVKISQHKSNGIVVHFPRLTPIDADRVKWAYAFKIELK